MEQLLFAANDQQQQADRKQQPRDHCHDQHRSRQPLGVSLPQQLEQLLRCRSFKRDRAIA